MISTQSISATCIESASATTGRFWGSIEAAYGTLGLPFDASMRTSIPAYLDAKPKGKFGVHRYDPARLGLDESGLRNQFADYIAHYDVELEDG